MYIVYDVMLIFTLVIIIILQCGPSDFLELAKICPVNVVNVK